MELVGDIDTEFDKLYGESSLPNKPDIKGVDELCISIVKGHLTEVGLLD